MATAYVDASEYFAPEGSLSFASADSLVITGASLLEVVVTTADRLAANAIAATGTTATDASPSSDLVKTANYLLDNILGLDRSGKLVEVVAQQGADKNGLITLNFNYAPGAWPKAILEQFASAKIFSIEIDQQKLVHDREYVIDLQKMIKDKIDGEIGKVVAATIGSTTGYEHGVAAAASTALKALLSSNVANSLSGVIGDSLLKLQIPERSDVIKIFDTTFEAVGGEFFRTFVPEIAKVYGKLGLSEILAAATSGLSPDWAVAINSVGKGVFEPIISNIVTDYFTYGPPRPLLNGVNFSDVFGKAIAKMLVDFNALDKKIVDDVLGIDGKGFIEENIAGFSKQGPQHVCREAVRKGC